MSRSRPHDSFEYEQWIESIAGETLRVTAWPGTTVASLVPSAVQPTYCPECDEDVMLLTDDVIGGETVGHCPACGSLPGLHEIETKNERHVASDGIRE